MTNNLTYIMSQFIIGHNDFVMTTYNLYLYVC